MRMRSNSPPSPNKRAKIETFHTRCLFFLFGVNYIIHCIFYNFPVPIIGRSIFEELMKIHFVFLLLVSRTSIDSKYRKNTLFFIYDGTFLECVVWSTNMYYSHSVFNFAGKPCIISQIELLEYFSWIFKANVKL